MLTNQGRPEKPDVRVCRLPDIQKKLLTRRNITQDMGELGAAGQGEGTPGVVGWRGKQRVGPQGRCCILCSAHVQHSIVGMGSAQVGGAAVTNTKIAQGL